MITNGKRSLAPLVVFDVTNVKQEHPVMPLNLQIATKSESKRKEKKKPTEGGLWCHFALLIFYRFITIADVRSHYISGLKLGM